MNPNYSQAATKAKETVAAFGNDPLEILNKLRNVVVIAYSISDDNSSSIVHSNMDALTLVNRKNGKLQYIVLYNSSLSFSEQRPALARELGHVMLKHDGNGKEFVWMEEANCFAYRFLSIKKKKIQYRTKQKSIYLELMTTQPFDSIESIKIYVADKKNRFNRIIGDMHTHYTANDVKLYNKSDYDSITGWKNCFDVVLDGETVGYCGE